MPLPTYDSFSIFSGCMHQFLFWGFVGKIEYYQCRACGITASWDQIQKFRNELLIKSIERGANGKN